jgi:stage III sporulation protein SpoIIIAA
VCSVIKNREDGYTGATLRVGRHVTGNIDFLRDLLTNDPRALDSILFLGVPGTGKTTLIR